MNATMFINRNTNWFFFEDVNIDPFYCSIQILQKLSTRKTMGLKYNRLELLKSVFKKSGTEALDNIDSAILILLSRKLISIKKTKELESNIYITDDGLNILKKFKEEVKKC